MGWVSMNEDIQELRDQRAHFEIGFDNVLRWVRERQPDSLKQAELEEKELERLWARVQELLGNTRENVLRVFNEAEKRLSDPNVRIVKKLDKKKAEIDDLRMRLGRSETELAKCRSSRERLQSEFERVSREAESLREEVAWRREAENIRSIRKPRRAHPPTQ